MSTDHAVDHSVQDAHVAAGDHLSGDYEEHHPDRFYVQIAAILAAITGLEITLSYIHIGSLFMPLLIILMIIKFFMVVLFFMHLKFDSKWFSFFFYSGLGLAVAVYCAFLATFRFFMKH